MENSYFILAKHKFEIERFHLCTWDLKKDNAHIEFGFEIAHDSFKNIEEREIVFIINVPYLVKKDTITCLYKELIDSETNRFIFNDTSLGRENINNKNTNEGVIENFVERGKLAIVPCDYELNEENNIILKVKNKKEIDCNIYFRIILSIDKKTLAELSKDITKISYTYDIRLNERRNLTSHLEKYIYDSNLSFCNIKTFFCFHIYPIDFSIAYVTQNKLKSVRRLENENFKKYLPFIKSLSNPKKKYEILFNKDSARESYSLYSILAKESIGYKQVFLAIIVNILCSFGFFVLSNLDKIKELFIKG